MKIKYAMLGVTAGAALFLASGCSKEEPPAGETPKAMNPAPSEAQKAPAEPAPPPAATLAVPAAATQAVTEAAAAPSNASAQAQGLIDKAKGLVTDQKYQEALNVVQQLSGQTLTAEQQTLVDGLKAQIQAALAKTTGAGAASAVGDALGGKK